MFVISGPSGVGKTVLCNHMVTAFNPDVVYSISSTSRKPSDEEKNGQEYFFLTSDEFKQAISRGEFAEWALVHGNYYGTPRVFLDQQLNFGRHVVLNIDVQGAFKIRKEYPDSKLVFILPPSMNELEQRIRLRRRDSESDLQMRLENARKEMEFVDQYDFQVVNDNLEQAQKRLEGYFSREIKANPLY